MKASYRKSIGYLFIAALVASLCACKADKSNVALIALDIAPEGLVEQIDLADFVVVDEIIPLKFHSDGVFATINKVMVYHDLIYVMDSQGTNGLYVFTVTGEFLRKITSSGNGPGELSIIRDFDVRPSDGSVMVLAGAPRKVLNYNGQGDFVSERSISISARHIVQMPGDLRIYETNPISGNEYLWWESGGEIVHKEVLISQSDISSNTSRLVDHGGFKRLRNEVFVMPTLSNVLYRVNDAKADSVAVLNLGEKFTPSYDKYFKDDREMAAYLAFYQTGSHLVFQYPLHDGVFCAIYNKRDRRQVLGKLYGVVSPEAGIAMALFNTVYADEDHLWARIDSDHIAYWNWVVQHSEKSSEIFSDIDEAMNQLAGVEMNDHVLVKFRLKNI